MKAFILSGLSGIIILFSFQATAQQDLHTSILSVVQQDKIVSFNIGGSIPFYVGGNMYILHIGNKEYRKYQQITTESDKGLLHFYLSEEDVAQLQENEPIYLTYGELEKKNVQTMEAYLQEHTSTCWSLGKYTHTMLTK